MVLSKRIDLNFQLSCDVLGVSKSGYDDRQHHKPGKRALANRQLDAQVKAISHQHKQRYGSPRITKALRVQNDSCNQARIARRMKTMNLKAVAKKKFKMTTDSNHNPTDEG